MSLPTFNNEPGEPSRKPRADVYTVLLVIALLAILLGILCLYLEQLDMYPFTHTGGPAVTLRQAETPVAYSPLSTLHSPLIASTDAPSPVPLL